MVRGKESGERAALIECHGLTKRYGRTRALDGLELVLGDPAAGAGGVRDASGDPGEDDGPIALVGPNGAGKTTLFSVLCGFVRPSSGRVRVLGCRPGSSALRGRLAALPQDAAFDPRASVGASLRHFAALQGFSGRAARDEAARVLERVGLEDASGGAPGALSHGMRKRAALAQALIGDPELVLLDEPTAGVDPPNVRIIHALVRELSVDTRFLISSHNLDELERLTSRVVYLEAGRLSGRGSRAEALADEANRLTVSFANVDDARARELLGALAGVRTVTTGGRGEHALEVDDADAVAQRLLVACAERGWRWRSLVRGRSLEQRLYDD